jgi:arginyl-tRNA synthetase
MLINIIKQEFLKVLSAEPYNLQDLSILVPPQKEFGDFATNIAFSLSKRLRQNPIQIAEKISQDIKSPKIKVSPLKGFINITVSNEIIWEELKKIDANFGLSIAKDLFPNKILLEYVSANPTGPLHIGHGRWAAMGDTLYRILKFAGADIDTEFYINDAGNQIDKLLESIEAVRHGNAPPEDGYHGSYIKELAAGKDPVHMMVERQKKTLREYRVEFTNWLSEKSLHNDNSIKITLNELEKTGLIYRDNGAIWLKTTKFEDDKDRVLVKDDGNPTYFLVDIAYHINKISRGYRHIINIWGADHHGYVKRIQSVIKALYPNSTIKIDIIIGQLVSLYRNGEPVRMSKRTGEMITVDDLIEEIGVDAARYFMTTRSFDTHLDFDLEVAKQKSNDNPVYYVQYAHARINSIFKQLKVNPDYSRFDLIDLTPYEHDLAIQLLNFQYEIRDIAMTYAIQKLPFYLEETAKKFHSFYHNCRVLGETSEITNRRLFLISKVQEIINLGLSLMAVSAPLEM